jgi:hypothetical protein
MSAGAFTRSRYQASYDDAEIHPIRVQPETIAMADSETPATTNAAPTDSITNPISAKVSAGRRELGLKPRKFVLEVTGTPPTGYSTGSQVTLPILTETFYNALAVNDTVSYLGATWEVISKIPEDVS